MIIRKKTNKQTNKQGRATIIGRQGQGGIVQINNVTQNNLQNTSGYFDNKGMHGVSFSIILTN